MLKEISNRRAVREYSEKPVSDEDVLEIIKAGQFAPSAMNNRGVEFIVVRNPEIKEKLYQIVGQEFVKNAPVVIVPVLNPSKSTCPVEDLAVASENMFLEATALGLGTVWKSIRKELREEVKKVLEIPQDFLVINLIPVGYPKETPQPHSEADFNSSRIHYEKYLA